ncbi:hypothetical protein B0I33_105260 [Prauserella shujinwangii]|uniref:Uncharacterized protein n=1 Tax=Prauserella shujinwangii TaxID=1453103 RepID=A0A2T0LV06_9PSEU|nr:hypothetical protein [Prauserella shujinwangii]PRX47680.1 hypothetical protein B0I33_105260 [Prauserella shujinwangii]
MVGNVLIYLAVVIAPTATCWVILMLPRLVAAARRRRAPEPQGPPVERLAADLRRVRHSLATLPPNAPMVRRRATGEAYDALLAQACRAVGVAHRLDAVPEGIDRELERLRVEEALRGAGLAIP